MNVYIWKYIEQCSSHYHSDGGVVVVAPTEAEARWMANNTPGCGIKPEEAPDRVIPCSNDEPPEVFIFPDAGRC